MQRRLQGKESNFSAHPPSPPTVRPLKHKTFDFGTEFWDTNLKKKKKILLFFVLFCFIALFMVRVGETDNVSYRTSYIIKILKNRKLYSYIMKVKISLQKETHNLIFLEGIYVTASGTSGYKFKPINS